MDGVIMNTKILRTIQSVFPLIVLTAGISLQARAQTSPQTSQPEQSRTQVNQTTQDVFGQLNLTPEQIQKIRGINAELKDQRQAANQRLRQSQKALAEAVESPTPNEALIDQRSRDVADAQSSVIRLRSLTEARVLQVMTPEQRIRLREIRQRNQALRREANQQGPGNVWRQRQQGLPRNANGAGPNQRRLIKRQQKR
jgi:Spy/CpxP family protein refolding chaperone